MKSTSTRKPRRPTSGPQPGSSDSKRLHGDNSEEGINPNSVKSDPHSKISMDGDYGGQVVGPCSKTFC